MGVMVAGEFGESLRTLTLTCSLCGAVNVRELPYDMLAPDVCSRCVEPFPRALTEPCPDCPPGTAFRQGDPNCSCGGVAVVIARPPDQWIQTFSGRQYWPLDPRPSDVTVEDIAHHLGYICRFSGACRRFYSVAEHSSHVSHVVDAALMYRDDISEDDKRLIVLAAHLHDAEEYVPPHDVARPVKYADECTFLRAVGDRNSAAIFEALGVDRKWLDVPLIKDADNAMLLAEQETIMAPPPAAWVPMDVPADLLELARYRMKLANEHGICGAGSPDKAGWAWLLRYRELTEF